MFLRAFRLVYVSIPLGTINTVRSRTRLVVSSVSIPLGTINTSSFYPSLNNLVVSIPLGTINTRCIQMFLRPSALFQFH